MIAVGILAGLVVVLTIAVVRLSRTRLPARPHLFDQALYRTEELAVRLATERRATDTAQRSASSDTRATTAEERAAAAEERTAVLRAELRAALDRERALKATAIEDTARATALGERVVRAERIVDGAVEQAVGDLARHLWQLELARVEREWRVDAAPSAGTPSPLDRDDQAFAQALGMELLRLWREESGALVDLRPASRAPPSPGRPWSGCGPPRSWPSAPAGSRRWLDLSADEASLVLTLSGDGGESEAARDP